VAANLITAILGGIAAILAAGGTVFVTYMKLRDAAKQRRTATSDEHAAEMAKLEELQAWQTKERAALEKELKKVKAERDTLLATLAAQQQLKLPDA
jgi:septal ring factor EnvC (AmiA/AmiB activator)